MSRPVKVLLTLAASVAVGAVASACGTEKVALSPSNPLYKGAVLFNQRCSGCHTLSYAATHGSAQFVRTKEFNNGPNFNVRCERPVARVLYAIENGGYSGQIMPQNIVVGQDATLVAKFVATYAGRQAPSVPGIVPCQKLAVGTIPPPATGTSSTGTGSTGGAGSTGSVGSTGGAGSTTSTTSTTAQATTGGTSSKSSRKGKAHRSRRKAKRP